MHHNETKERKKWKILSGWGGVIVHPMKQMTNEYYGKFLKFAVGGGGGGGRV